ncbi:MAG: hypothetical protein PHV42_03690, partial [Candidatus Pacebacteria bacterium]|nr:hypothetical protein [Candidatus Paceibacterota bacterium]
MSEFPNLAATPREEKSPIEKLKAALQSVHPAHTEGIEEKLLEAIASRQVLLDAIIENPWRIASLEEYGSNPEFFELDEEHMNQFLFNLRSREDALSQSHRDLNDRLKNNPIGSEQELRMGVYLEELEPQVREAVSELEKRGWLTFESGFRNLVKGSQYLGFHKEANLKSYTLPKDLYENLLIHGVKLELHFNENYDRDTLLLIPDRNISLDEWKSIWNTV